MGSYFILTPLQVLHFTVLGIYNIRGGDKVLNLQFKLIWPSRQNGRVQK